MQYVYRNQSNINLLKAIQINPSSTLETSTHQPQTRYINPHLEAPQRIQPQSLGSNADFQGDDLPGCLVADGRTIESWSFNGRNIWCERFHLEKKAFEEWSVQENSRLIGFQ